MLWVGEGSAREVVPLGKRWEPEDDGRNRGGGGVVLAGAGDSDLRTRCEWASAPGRGACVFIVLGDGTLAAG